MFWQKHLRSERTVSGPVRFILFWKAAGMLEMLTELFKQPSSHRILSGWLLEDNTWWERETEWKHTPTETTKMDHIGKKKFHYILITKTETNRIYHARKVWKNPMQPSGGWRRRIWNSGQPGPQSQTLATNGAVARRREKGEVESLSTLKLRALFPKREIVNLMVYQPKHIKTVPHTHWDGNKDTKY